ncbi:MAG: hypothetical protein HYZ75_15655 [Elusimicrobia bacterium]|nr:hypothetical protein [Elusimicrobiota bacterium]
MSIVEKLRYRYVDAGAVVKDGKKFRKFSRVRRFSAETERGLKVCVGLLFALAAAAAFVHFFPASELPAPTNTSPFE